jgi:CheY-like chemotaxis protein
LLTATTVTDKSPPDVVCADVNMPTGNGLRFCEMLAADPKTAEVPIIVLTGQQDADTRQTCERLHAHYLFKKGDVWAKLEPLIHELVSEPRSAKSAVSTCTPPRQSSTSRTPSRPAAEQPGGTKSSAARQTRQIVVADDDPDLVHMLSQRCSALGCSVVGVDSALEAINVIHRMTPDLVILDVNMPSGNGLSVCEMMATDERLRTVPVIILTGQSDEQTIRRCHDMLVFYVQKGAEVWGRIEPLVGELLHLDESPAGANGARPTEPMPSPSREASTAPKPRSDLMDAVFAMLGTDAEATRTTADAVDTESAAADEDKVPWVLCIDDDPDVSDALKTRLEEHGVAVVRAFDGMAGYRLAFTHAASAILLDYILPNGQGDYVLDRLKTNPVTKDIPVFVVTGTKDKMLERRMLAMGAAGFFLKPVNFDSLRQQLANHIDILAAPARPLAASARS